MKDQACNQWSSTTQSHAIMQTCQVKPRNLTIHAPLAIPNKKCDPPPCLLYMCILSVFTLTRGGGGGSPIPLRSFYIIITPHITFFAILPPLMGRCLRMVMMGNYAITPPYLSCPPTPLHSIQHGLESRRRVM